MHRIFLVLHVEFYTVPCLFAWIAKRENLYIFRSRFSSLSTGAFWKGQLFADKVSFVQVRNADFSLCLWRSRLGSRLNCQCSLCSSCKKPPVPLGQLPSPSPLAIQYKQTEEHSQIGKYLMKQICHMFFWKQKRSRSIAFFRPTISFSFWENRCCPESLPTKEHVIFFRRKHKNNFASK